MLLSVVLLSAVALSALNVQRMLYHRAVNMNPPPAGVAEPRRQLTVGAPTVRLQLPDDIPLEEIIRRVTGFRRARQPEHSIWPWALDGEGMSYDDCMLTKGEETNQGCESFMSASELSEVPGLLTVYSRSYQVVQDHTPEDDVSIGLMKFDSPAAAWGFLQVAPKWRSRFVSKNRFVFDGLEVFVDRERNYVWYVQSDQYLLNLEGSDVTREMGDRARTFLQKMIATYGVPL